MIDKNIVDEYLEIIGEESLNLKIYELIDIQKTDKSRFNKLENENIALEKQIDLSLPKEELISLIKDLKRTESYTNTSDGKKIITKQRLEAEKLLEILESDLL